MRKKSLNNRKRRKRISTRYYRRGGANVSHAGTGNPTSPYANERSRFLERRFNEINWNKGDPWNNENNSLLPVNSIPLRTVTANSGCPANAPFPKNINNSSENNERIRILEQRWGDINWNEEEKTADWEAVEIANELGSLGRPAPKPPWNNENNNSLQQVNSIPERTVTANSGWTANAPFPENINPSLNNN